MTSASSRVAVISARVVTSSTGFTAVTPEHSQGTRTDECVPRQTRISFQAINWMCSTSSIVHSLTGLPITVPILPSCRNRCCIATRCDCKGGSFCLARKRPRMYWFKKHAPGSTLPAKLSAALKCTWVHRRPFSRCYMMTLSSLSGYSFALFILKLRWRLMKLIETLDARKTSTLNTGRYPCQWGFFNASLRENLLQWFHKSCNWLSRTALSHRLVSTNYIHPHMVI